MNRSIATQSAAEASVEMGEEKEAETIEQDFESVCKMHHLTEETIGKLVANGISSLEILKLVKKEHMSQVCTDWQLGQVLALEALLTKLQEPDRTMTAQKHIQPQQMLVNQMDASGLGAFPHTVGNGVPGTSGLGHSTTPNLGLAAGWNGLPPSPVMHQSQQPVAESSIPPPAGVRPMGLGTAQGDLRNILQMMTAGNAATSTTHQLPGIIDDPTVHLIPQNSTTQKGEKPLLIVDFASDLGAPCETREQILSEQDGQSIVVKSSARKIKLDQISPAQWISANARILAELLRTGKLQQDKVLNYLGYTAKVGDLALRYSWLSVLYYDHEYRHLQAQYQFEWGRDAPHLATTRLRERQSGNNHSAKPMSKKVPICRNYNSKGCSLSVCSYKHICSEPGCGKPHSKVNHSKEA